MRKKHRLKMQSKLADQVVRTNTKYGPHFIKQKISQHLMTKGFSRSVIEKAIEILNRCRSTDEGENSILA